MTELDPNWEWIEVRSIGMPARFIKGPCRHLSVVPVESIVTGDTLAWLCVNCDQQLAQRPESAYCSFTNAEQQRFELLAARYDTTSDPDRRFAIMAELKALSDRRS